MLYHKTMDLSRSRHALLALGAVAFIEASVFPIPPHVMIVPMVLAAPQRAWTIALVATLGSVMGGVLGYWIGAELFQSVGRPVLEFYGKDAYFVAFQDKFNEFGAFAVLMAGITPFPYKVITILSGATGLNFGVFVLCSVAARGLIFFAMALILWRFGPPVRGFIERRFALVTTAFFVLLFGGFLAVGML